MAPPTKGQRRRPGAPTVLETRRSLLAFMKTLPDGVTELSAFSVAPLPHEHGGRREQLRSASFVLSHAPGAAAGTPSVWTRFHFLATGVSRWSLTPDDDSPPGLVRARSVYLHSRPRGSTTLQFGAFECQAELWKATPLSPQIAPMPPMLDRYSSEFVLPAKSVPSPAQLCRLLAKEGVPTVWATREGIPVAAFTVPASFESHSLYVYPPPRLRFPDHLTLSLWDAPGGKAIRLTCDETALRDRTVAVLCRLPGMRVSSGNCTFTGLEWLARTSGQTPEPLLAPEVLQGGTFAKVIPLRR